MLDPAIPLMQRSTGRAALRLGARDGGPIVEDLFQTGSARVFVPRTGRGLEDAIFVNTSGGLTGGDRLDYALTLAADLTFTASTQTAERAYLAGDDPARIRVGAQVGPGGRLVWLPQETILFEGSNLDRRTEIDLATGASCVLVETVILGRLAMKERPRAARLSDRRMIRIAGRPVWAENIRIDARVLAASGSAAMLGDCTCFGVLVLVGAGAETAADSIPAIPPPVSVSSAVSGWNGRTILRLQSPDPWALKLHLARVAARLTGRPIPKSWQIQGMAA